MMEMSNSECFFPSNSFGGGVPFDGFDPLNFNFGYGAHLF